MLYDVAGILVGHTHFDHAIDVAALACRFGVDAYGSALLAHLYVAARAELAGGRGRPDRTYEIGPFVVRFVPSLHSKLILGYAVPSDGELTCEHLDALSPTAYRCGRPTGSTSPLYETTLYHQGSANLIDELVLAGGVDVLLAADRGEAVHRPLLGPDPAAARPRGWCSPATTTTSSARSPSPAAFSLNVRLAAVPGEIAAGAARVATLPPLMPVSG